MAEHLSTATLRKLRWLLIPTSYVKLPNYIPVRVMNCCMCPVCRIGSRTTIQITKIDIVHQDGDITRRHVERVQGADGQVIRRRVGVVEVEASDDGVAGGCLEFVADLEVLGFDERGLGDVVERVVERCGERAAVGRDVVRARDVTRTRGVGSRRNAGRGG